MTTTVGKYGKRVIGEAAVQREKEVVRKAATKYGPRVIGHFRSTTPTQQDPDPGEAAGKQREAETAALKQENEALAARIAELEAKVAGANTEAASETPQAVPQAAPQAGPEGEGGADETGGKGEGTGDVVDFERAAKKAAGADGYLNVAELTAAVQANPALVDGFLAREIEREPRPRVSALRALLAAETGEGGQRRPDVAARIEEAIAGLGAE